MLGLFYCASTSQAQRDTDRIHCSQPHRKNDSRHAGRLRAAQVLVQFDDAPALETIVIELAFQRTVDRTADSTPLTDQAVGSALVEGVRGGMF